MSKTKGVRVLVEQFLSASVDQIVEAVEKMISGYEEEMFQSKRKISGRRKMLDALLQPETRLNGTSKEAQLNLSVLEEDLLTEQQQEWNSCEVSVKHSLSVAAERIMEAVEKMVSGYKGEMHQSRREISRQHKMINDLLQPEIRLTRIPDEMGKVEEPQPVTSAEQMPIESYEEVPSPGFSEPENADDDDWNATEDGDSDRNDAIQSEEWSPTPSGQQRTLTGNKPQTKKRSCGEIICKVCRKSFNYRGSFMKHLKSHPKDDCGLCGMHFETEEDLEVHLKTHKKEKTRRIVKAVVCEVCGKCLYSQGNLKMHMRSHTGEKPFACEVCGKSFNFRQNMTRHLTTHTKEKPFRCEFCGKSFSYDASLARHHLIHTGENPYQCTICSEHFIRYSTLRKHMRTHLKVDKITTPVHDNEDVDAEVITKDQLVQITCKVCGNDFNSKVSLVNHLESHPKDDCGLCGMHFNTEEDFELHLKTHKDEVAKVCDVCGKCFAKPFYLEIHMRSHTGEKRFKCTVCDKAFRRRTCLTRHLGIHTGEKPFSCTRCSKCFTTNCTLRQHMRRCGHSATDEIDKVEEPLPATSAEKMIIEADEEVPSPGFSDAENEDDVWNATKDGDSEWSPTPSKQHCKLTGNTPQTKQMKKSCKVCGKSFHYEGSLLKHLESHPKDVCGVCGMMHFKTEEDFELHLKTHKNEIKTRKSEIKARKNEKVVFCEVCGKCFSKRGNLKMHMRRHTGDKPFICEVCGKSFSFLQGMTKHLRTHTGEKPFRCELCGKSFSQPDSLTRHHLTHTGENPYPCTICSEHFIRYSTLRKHMRTHKVKRRITVTSTTPVYDDGDVDADVITKRQLVRIICKVCGNDFHSKVSLVNHLESHPKDDCGLCGMHFNTEEDFELHLKTHKDEIARVCDVCGKSFAKPFYLEIHMRGHTGEKRFKCSVCDKAFRQGSALKQHLRIHTGEKPFSCTACSKCFKTNSNLYQHMKRCRIAPPQGGC